MKKGLILYGYFFRFWFCFASRMTVSSLSLAISSFEGRIPSIADEEITERSMSSSRNNGSFKYGLVSFNDFFRGFFGMI